MASYNLEQLQPGTTAIASGRWTWYVIRLNSMPEKRCELQHLIFVSELPDGGNMRARVASDVTVIDDAAVRLLAEKPEDRSIRGANGWITVYPPIATDTAKKCRVRPEKRNSFLADVHSGRSLGELSRDEMLEIDAEG